MSADFQTYDDAHVYADTDKGPNSIHHTLGNQPQQASPGDHDHDKNYSLLGHAHTEADVASLVSDLAGKSPVGHTHTRLRLDWWHVSQGTGATQSGYWTPIAKFDLTAQYDDSIFEAIVTSYGSGSPSGQFAHIRARVKQQNPLGQLLSTSLFVWDNYGCDRNDFYLEVSSNTAGECYGYLWARIPAGYDQLATVCLSNAGNKAWLQTNNSGLYAGPAGIAGSTYAWYLNDSVSSFKVHNNAVQSIPNATWTSVLFQLEDWDEQSDFAASKFTAPVAGVYHFDATVEFNPNSVGIRYARFAVNGVAVPGRSGGGASSASHAQATSTDLKLAAGDTVEVHCYQTSGAALNVIATAPDAVCSFNGHLVRRV